MSPNVIEAAAAFQCRHLYAAVTPRSLFMFVCIRCGHRAECLQLNRRREATRVLAFPRRAFYGHSTCSIRATRARVRR
jgi:hypothetical protein